MYNDRILLYEYETMEKELRNLLYQYQEKLWIDSLGKSFDDREIYRIIVGNKTQEESCYLQEPFMGENI